MQVSSVCRKLSTAATAVFGSFHATELEVTPGINLGSRLLQSWAQHIPALVLQQGVSHMMGIRSFLTAATRLRAVQLGCFDLLEAAEADRMLRICTRLTELRLTGSHMPHFYPPGLTRLSAEFDGRDEPEEMLWDPLVPSCLLCDVADQTAVEDMVLDIHTACVQLRCPLQLPRLQVDLRFQLEHESELDLSWLQQQPCSKLIIQVHVGTDEPAQHALLVDQLRQLPNIHELMLNISEGLSLGVETQCLYQQLTISQEFHLWGDSEAFASTSQALRCLPSSPLIRISFTDRKDGPPVFIDWAAVVNQAGRVCVSLDGRTLKMVGGRAISANLAKPWQLSIHKARSVCGLDGVHAGDRVTVTQERCPSP